MSGDEASDDEIGEFSDPFAKANEFLEVTGFSFGEAYATSPTRKNLI